MFEPHTIKMHVLIHTNYNKINFAIEGKKYLFMKMGHLIIKKVTSYCQKRKTGPIAHNNNKIQI